MPPKLRVPTPSCVTQTEYSKKRAHPSRSVPSWKASDDNATSNGSEVLRGPDLGEFSEATRIGEAATAVQRGHIDSSRCTRSRAPARKWFDDSNRNVLNNGNKSFFRGQLVQLPW